MQIILFGPPGCGKGTQASLIAGALSIPHLSTGDMLRSAVSAKSEIGFKAKEISVSPVNDLWLIGLDNLVYKLESDKLVDKSMKASRIAVNGDQILVVDDHKNVHQLINQKWEFIDHSIREIAISSDGKVLAIGKGYFLMEFNGLYFRPFAS